MKEQKITDKTFHDASALLLQEMMEEEEANTEPVELSPEFRARMEELLKNHKKEKVKTYRSRRRIWTTVAMIIIALFTWLAVDVKARASIAEWFESVIEGVFHYSFSGSAVDGTMPSYRLGWIPEGGKQVRETESEERGSYSIGIQYGNDYIDFNCGKYDEGWSMGINVLNHDVVHNQLSVKGKTVDEYYDVQFDEYDYVWMDDEKMICFTLFSTFDHDTNVKIIETIKDR